MKEKKEAPRNYLGREQGKLCIGGINICDGAKYSQGLR